MASVDTLSLTNDELVQNWGPAVYRIRLETQGKGTSGRLLVRVTSL
jgi:hypothetical protein